MRTLYFILTMTVLMFSGCFQKPPQPETALFHDFSLETIVSGMKTPELQSVSTGFGKTEALGEIVRRRRDQFGIYKIAEREGSKFDDIRFLSQLRAEVVKIVTSSGMRIDGSGSANDNFHLDYSGPGHTGSLEVFGTRTEGNQFKLWSVIRENTLKEAK